MSAPALEVRALGCTVGNRRLFDALGAHKKLIELPGRGHNDWTDAMTAENWQEALAFLEGR